MRFLLSMGILLTLSTISPAKAPVNLPKYLPKNADLKPPGAFKWHITPQEDNPTNYHQNAVLTQGPLQIQLSLTFLKSPDYKPALLPEKRGSSRAIVELQGLPSKRPLLPKGRKFYYLAYKRTGALPGSCDFRSTEGRAQVSLQLHRTGRPNPKTLNKLTAAEIRLAEDLLLGIMNRMKADGLTAPFPNR